MPRVLDDAGFEDAMSALADAKSLLDRAAGILVDKFQSALGKMPTTDIAEALFRLKEQHSLVDNALKPVYNTMDGLNKAVLPQRLETEGQDMIRVPHLARSFSIRTQYSASFLDKEKGFEWLRSNGHEDMITETVNAGTLAAFCRGMIVEEGIDPPADVVRVSTYNIISINKYSPKPGVPE